MAKIINLDELIPEQQTVILDGQEHPLNPPSVEVYLQVLKSRERMKNASEEVEQMTQAIMLIELCCPTIAKERLQKLPMRALTALADAIQSQMEESVHGDESGEIASDVP